MSAPRPLTGGAVMAGASRIMVAVTGAATTIVIARLLGPEGSGAYFVAQNVVLLLTVATTLGVEHGITYYVSAGRWAPRNAFRAALAMSATVGTAGALVGFAARLLVPSAFAGLTVWETAVVVTALPFSLVWFYVTFIALAIDRYEAFVLPPAGQSTIALLLAVPGAIAFGVPGAVVALSLSGIVVGIAAALWAGARLPAGGGGEEAHMLRPAISFGIKGYAANALQMINYRVDLFILSAAVSAAAVGQYAVAVAVTSLLRLAPAAVADVLFPRVAHLSAQEGADAEAHREMAEVKSIRHVVLTSVLATIVLAAALVLLVVPVYGEAFRPAVDLGLILLPGVALVGLASVLSATIVGRGKPIYSLYIALITTPVTIALYVVLIPSLGATGAALGSTLSYTLTFVLGCVFYRRATGRRVLRVLWPGRSEIDDLRRLPRAVATWAAGLRT